MLQIGYGLADGGLREIQPLGRTAETAGFEYSVKAAQLMTFNLHGVKDNRAGSRLGASAAIRLGLPA